MPGGYGKRTILIRIWRRYEKFGWEFDGWYLVIVPSLNFPL
jgi:hypothetical protein